MVYRGRPVGTSMWPFIRNGDEIVVEQVLESEIRLRDVLVFSGGGKKLIAHRLICVEESGAGRRYVMRGDFRRWPDRPVSYESIVGKVAAIERRGKTIRPDGALQRSLAWVWPWIRALPLLGWSISRRLLRGRR